MNRIEIKAELERVFDALKDEDLKDILFYSKHIQDNLLVEKADDFKKFYDMISMIVKRPAMFGIQNIEGLSLFIMGVRFTSGLSDIANDFNNKFNKYVNQTYADDFKPKNRNFNWPRLVRLYSSGDRHSIELFGLWFDNFLDIYKKELSGDNLGVTR